MVNTPPSPPPPDDPTTFDLTRWRAESLWALVAAARQLAAIRRTLEEVEAVLRRVGPVVLALAILAGAA